MGHINAQSTLHIEGPSKIRRHHHHHQHHHHHGNHIVMFVKHVSACILIVSVVYQLPMAENHHEEALNVICQCKCWHCRFNHHQDFAVDIRCSDTAHSA